jgi:hypothetical protein
MKNRVSIDTIPDFLLDGKEKILTLRKLINSQLSLFEKLIDINGEVICIKKNKSEIEFEDLFHDFIFFALTKSYKSFRASLILADNFFQEDSQIIIRSIYESYLAIKYISKTPSEIYNFTYKALGISTNQLSHPLSKNGRLQKNKIFNPITGNVEEFGLSITKMAENLESEHEISLHKTLYPYLCEHTHLNMIASGNYRNNEQNKYLHNSLEGSYKPFIYLAYLLILFIDYLTTDAGLYNQKLGRKMFALNKLIKKELLTILVEHSKDDSMIDFINIMISRIMVLKEFKKVTT